MKCEKSCGLIMPFLNVITSFKLILFGKMGKEKGECIDGTKGTRAVFGENFAK